MTDWRSLDDEIFQMVAEDRVLKWIDCEEYASMRAIADWQLEKVIEFLKNNLNDKYIDDGDVLAPGIDVKSVIDDLKEAMRPRQQQEDQDA